MNYFTCKICNRYCNSLNSLATHIGVSHKIDKKVYYTKYLGNPVGICECGKETKFRGMNVGFDKFCSNKCSANSKTTREKYTETCIEKYGVESASKTAEFKEMTRLKNLATFGAGCIFETDEFKEKSKHTCLTKYGTEHASQNIDVLKKMKETNIDKYGVDSTTKMQSSVNNRNRVLKEKFGESGSPFVAKENQRKSVNTRVKRYGVPYTLSAGSQFTDSIVEKTAITINKQTVDFYTPLLAKYNCDLISYKNEYFTYTCNKCNNELTETYAITRTRLLADTEPCTICNPRQKFTSHMEKTLCDFIKTFDLEMVENTSYIISPKELDIYLPNNHIAFEFNGLYHHSESFKPSDYHKIKSDMCMNKNIELIHIFEDDWRDKRDIVKSKITGLLGKYTNVINCSQCIVKELSENECNDFLNNNHLQGACESTHRYGLVFNTEIIMVMVFNIGKEISELLRYCTKINTLVTFGAGKLFKYVTNTHSNIMNMIAYIDRSFPIGSGYEGIGFALDSYTEPDYHYIIRDSNNNYFRENKAKYTKETLVNEGFDPEKSEHDIMLDRNIYRIYDCGNIKYNWKRK